MRILRVLLLCLSVTHSFSQDRFAFKAKLTSVDSSGFYKCDVPLAVLAQCRNDLADIRITNDNNQEVPFFVKNEQQTAKRSFLPLPIFSKAMMPDKKMHVRIKNSGIDITQLVLEVQNSYASRSVNINGSNDGKEWFVIRDNVIVSTDGNNNSASYIFVVDLPLSRASWFDISFNDKDLLPVNILAAGTYQSQRTPLAYDTIQTASIIQKDSSNKTSYLTLAWNEAYPVSQLKLEVSNPHYYRREIIFNRPNTSERYFIQAENKEWIPVESKAKNIQIQIANDDNSPLQIESAKGLVKKYTIYTWLEKNRTYTLNFGDSTAAEPQYDLVYFKDMIRDNAPAINIGDIEPNIAERSPVTASHSKGKLIWVAMALALMVLLIITFRFAAEVKRKTKVEES